MRHEHIRGAEVEGQVARALVAAARAHGIAATIEDHRSRPWASATFVGAQHRMTLAAERAPALAPWLAALPEADLTLRGHVVASLAVERLADDGAAVRVTLAVLTLEDG